jgi:hypothetical protein
MRIALRHGNTAMPSEFLGHLEVAAGAAQHGGDEVMPERVRSKLTVSGRAQRLLDGRSFGRWYDGSDASSALLSWRAKAEGAHLCYVA